MQQTQETPEISIRWERTLFCAHRPERFTAGPRTSSGPHSPKHPVVPYKMVPQGGKRVQARECEERVRQIPVEILGGLKYRRVLFDPKVEVKEPEMKDAGMVNEGHETDDWDDEHQRIERQMHRA
jgi:hypothetical protein